MFRFGIQMILLCFSFLFPILLFSQKKSFSVAAEVRYAGNKYALRKGFENTGSSDSKQFLISATKGLEDFLFVGIKTGVTLDKVYSSFANTDNKSESNLQLYFGLNTQKRIAGDKKGKLGLWAEVDFSVEPFISRSSLFTKFIEYPQPIERLLLYEGVYNNKKMRISLTPLIKAEIGFANKITAMCSLGYSVDMAKSNQWVFYRGNAKDFTGSNYNEINNVKENYLFFGLGIGYVFSNDD